jgi:hypothetical protein
MHRTSKARSLIRAGCAAASHYMRAALPSETPLGSSLTARASYHFAATSSPIAAVSYGVVANRSATAAIVQASESSSATRLGSQFLSTIVFNSAGSRRAGSGYSVLLSPGSSVARAAVVGSGALSSRPSRSYASMGIENNLLFPFGQ